MEIAMLRLDKFARYPLTFGPTPIEHRAEQPNSFELSVIVL
jgi:hypothetical protein